MIDMHMPELDGLDVARLYNFAAADDPSRTPIVMVTADNRPDLVADADLVGIAKFAIKPLRPSQLIQTVQDLMARRQNGASEPTAEPSVGELVSVLVDEPEVDDELFEELLGYMELDEARGFYKEFEEDARGFIDVVRRAMDGVVGAS
jgi:DNA-binding response OmpR family regulator